MTRNELKSKVSNFINVISTPAVRARAKDLRYSITDSAFDESEKKAQYFIQGTHLYKIDIQIKNGGQLFDVKCTCPYGFGCKHSVAALEHMADCFPLPSNSLSVETTKRAKPKAVQRKNASYPYVIPSYQKLLDHQLTQHVTPSSSNTYDLVIDSVDMAESDRTVFTLSENRYWSFRENAAETFKVDVMVKGEDLHLTCSCERHVKKLCKHGYAVLIHCHHDWRILEQPDTEEVEAMAQKVIKEFGLLPNSRWQDYFELIRTPEGYSFNTNQAHKGLISPHTIRQDMIEELSTWSLPSESFLKVNDKEERVPAFIFYENEIRHNLQLKVMTGHPEKDKQGRQKHLREFEASQISLSIQWEDSERELIKMANALASFNYNEDAIEAAYSLLNHHIHDLSEQKNLYVTDLHHVADLRKNEMQPVSFSPSTPKISIELSEDNNFIATHNYLLLSDHKINLNDDTETAILGHTLLRHQDHIYIIEPSTAHAINVLAKNQPSVTPTNFPDLFDLYLSKLAKKFSIDFSGVSSYNFKTETQTLQKKEIYLSEFNDFIIIRPIMQYAGGHAANALTDESIYQVEGNTYTEIIRDRKAEAEFVTAIKTLHDQFDNQNGTDYLYLTLDDFTSNHWFLNAFQLFKENDCTVYGWTDLKNIKHNPNPPQVNITVSSGEDWFEANGEIAYGNTTVGLEDIQKALINKSEYIELDDGTLGIMPAEWMERMEKLFRHGEIKDGNLRISDKLFSLVDELFDLIDDEQTLQKLQEKKEKLLSFEKIETRAIPTDISASLRPYQKDGFNWMCFLDEFKWGGILADDMGLGKTLQVLTFLTHVTAQNDQTNLLVIPTSLIFNWQNEIEKFNSKLTYIIHHGAARDRSTEKFKDVHLVFTTYGTLVSDIDIFKDYPFNYVILDESQAIKNPTSKRYKSACLLSAKNRLAMTGTPIENNTFDLFAQMNFLNPGLLGNMSSFKKFYASPIDKQKDNKRAEELQKVINPFVLRRTKEQVATELPDKVEDIIYCEMDSAQRKIYDTYRNYYRDKIMNQIAEEGLDKSRFSVLEGLTKLRQICDTPQLIKDENYQAHSTKMDELLSHIKEKTNHHKLLVFSQFVQMLKLIEQELKAQGISYAYLDGQSKPTERQASVEHFQTEEDCRVFLISLKAGGTGLNLTAADYVYLVDPWWNPAVENQAIDRCYRIGQDKKVIAYRMICKNTIEEKIISLQASKKALAQQIVNTDESVFKQLGRNEIMDLFS